MAGVSLENSADNLYIVCTATSKNKPTTIKQNLKSPLRALGL
jgi:hypothetical protein